MVLHTAFLPRCQPRLLSSRSVVDPISPHLRLDTPVGRIRIVHCTLNIARLLAAYYAKTQPRIPMPLGRTIIQKYDDGSYSSAVTLFPGTVMLPPQSPVDVVPWTVPWTAP